MKSFWSKKNNANTVIDPKKGRGRTGRKSPSDNFFSLCNLGETVAVSSDGMHVKNNPPLAKKENVKNYVLYFVLFKVALIQTQDRIRNTAATS